jgi:hypothetical protein
LARAPGVVQALGPGEPPALVRGGARELGQDAAPGRGLERGEAPAERPEPGAALEQALALGELPVAEQGPEQDAEQARGEAEARALDVRPALDEVAAGVEGLAPDAPRVAAPELALVPDGPRAVEYLPGAPLQALDARPGPAAPSEAPGVGDPERKQEPAWHSLEPAPLHAPPGSERRRGGVRTERWPARLGHSP